MQLLDFTSDGIRLQQALSDLMPQGDIIQCNLSALCTEQPSRPLSSHTLNYAHCMHTPTSSQLLTQSDCEPRWNITSQRSSKYAEHHPPYFSVSELQWLSITSPFVDYLCCHSPGTPGPTLCHKCKTPRPGRCFVHILTLSLTLCISTPNQLRELIAHR